MEAERAGPAGLGQPVGAGPAGLFTAAMVGRLVVCGRTRAALTAGAVALAIVLPVLAYILAYFSPTSPETFAAAQRLLAEVARTRRHGRPLALLMFDLDSFKQVNDRFGHLVGDDLLALFGSILREDLRASDLPCRYGGEEFLLIAPETNAEQARIVAERIRLKFRERSTAVGAGGDAGGPLSWILPRVDVEGEALSRRPEAEPVADASADLEPART